MQRYEGHKRGEERSEKATPPRRRADSRPDVGRSYRQRWITQQIKTKLIEEGHPEQCAICGAKDDLRVNHDTTGLVRGLLCGRCNESLESFRSSPKLLGRAATYLGRPLTRYVFDETIHLDVKPRRKGRKPRSE